MFESRGPIAITTLVLCVLVSTSHSVNPLIDLHYKVGQLQQINDNQRCKLISTMSTSYNRELYVPPRLSGVYKDLLNEVIIPGFEIANQIGDKGIKERFSDVTKVVTEEIARSEKENILIKCEKDIETFKKLRLKVTYMLLELNHEMSDKFEEEKKPKKLLRINTNSPSQKKKSVIDAHINLEEKEHDYGKLIRINHVEKKEKPEKKDGPIEGKQDKVKLRKKARQEIVDNQISFVEKKKRTRSISKSSEDLVHDAQE